MKRRIILVVVASILVALATLEVNGQEKSSLLWKVEKEGSQTSYLFGTIHLIPRNQFSISEKLSAAINTCDKLIIEADLSNQAAVLGAMQFARLPQGTRLDTMFTETEVTLLDSILQAESGMSLQAVNGFKPFFIESLLISNLITNDPVVIDLEITARIKEREVEVDALETIKEQMQMLDSIPYRKQLQELMTYLKGDVDMLEEYQKMLAIYLEEDLAGLYNYMYDYYEEDEILYYLLEKRNANWVPKLMTEMETKSVLVAVGAGHLGGPTGLINLLRENGYSLTPME